MPLPPVLEPMEDDRNELISIVEKLERPLEAEVRADLAGELVRFGARYEDVKEQAVYPALRDQLGESVDLRRVEDDRAAVREALEKVRHRTRHVKPINAHLQDAQGFEADLSELLEDVRRTLGHEEEDLFPLVDRLDTESGEDLRNRVEHAVRRASVHPNPPRNPITRALASIEEKVDRAVNDVSTTSHRAVERLREDA